MGTRIPNVPQVVSMEKDKNAVMINMIAGVSHMGKFLMLFRTIMLLDIVSTVSNLSFILSASFSGSLSHCFIFLAPIAVPVLSRISSRKAKLDFCCPVFFLTFYVDVQASMSLNAPTGA